MNESEPFGDLPLRTLSRRHDADCAGPSGYLASIKPSGSCPTLQVQTEGMIVRCFVSYVIVLVFPDCDTAPRAQAHLGGEICGV